MTLSKKQLRYRKLINENNHFGNIVGSIQNKLSAKQLSRLKILDKGEVYDLGDQIFLRCIDNRYCLPARKSEVLEKVDIFLEKYMFLLDSNLDDKRVRCIFMKSLMDFISAGSGLFFAKEDCDCRRFGKTTMVPEIPERVLFRFGEYFRQDFEKVCQVIGHKYSSIPKTQIYRTEAEDIRLFAGKPLALDEMMSISCSYAFWKLLKNKKINPKEFEEEFLRRCKGYFESLTQCSPIFLNKYKEGVFRELSSSLGMDTDRSYFVYLSFLKEPEGQQYKNKNDLSEFISGLFSEEELKMLELRKVQGDIGSFQEQIRDRYYSKYPSFVSMEEIEENIRKKVEEYKPLLNEDTVEVIRDVLLDEIERECFVSQTTYLGNQKMERNLKEGDCKCSNPVAKAIDLLVSMMPSNAVEQLSMKLNDKVFDLREQLVCRWNKAWFGCSLKDFQEYLSQMHIYTPYNFECGRDKENVSRTDLQTLLEEIDMFFLYPQKGRIIKKLMSRLDNGRLIGSENKERVKISQKGGSYSIFYGRYWIITFFLSVILILSARLASL